jgi:hypothetical protein
MVTTGQKQSVSSINQKFCWDAGAHLAEKNQESKLQYPEPLACTKLVQAMLHWENRRVPMPVDAGSKPSWEKQTKRWENKQHAEFPQLPLG